MMDSKITANISNLQQKTFMIKEGIQSTIHLCQRHRQSCKKYLNLGTKFPENARLDRKILSKVL